MRRAATIAHHARAEKITMQETLSRWLASSAGDYTLVEHPAVHTIDEALNHVRPCPA